MFALFSCVLRGLSYVVFVLCDLFVVCCGLFVVWFYECVMFCLWNVAFFVMLLFLLLLLLSCVVCYALCFEFCL